MTPPLTPFRLSLHPHSDKRSGEEGETRGGQETEKTPPHTNTHTPSPRLLTPLLLFLHHLYPYKRVREEHLAQSKPGEAFRYHDYLFRSEASHRSFDRSREAWREHTEEPRDIAVINSHFLLVLLLPFLPSFLSFFPGAGEFRGTPPPSPSLLLLFSSSLGLVTVHS